MRKLLYLGFKHDYINPTSNLMLKIYEKSAETLFIGPGFKNIIDFNNKNELENKINKFIPELIVIDARCFGSEFLKLNISGQDYSKKEFDEFIFFLNNFIKYNKIPLIVDFTFMDVYRLPVLLIEKLNQFSCYIIALDKNFFSSKENYKYLFKENFANSANDNWYNYIKENSHLAISLPHPIDENEFAYKKIYNRKIDFSVMGVKYYCRKSAGKILQKTNYKIYSSDFKRKCISFMITSLRKLSIKANKINNFYNSYFYSTLINSKISYTCGSGVEFPIRKFLEIPASGALLMCQKFKNFENFGFINKKNVIAVELNELEDAVHYYLRDLDLSQEIINNCQKFLLQNHSTKSRVKQMRDTLELISKNNFKGSSWKNGSFFLS